jgi:hypothetical protein
MMRTSPTNAQAYWRARRAGRGGRYRRRRWNACPHKRFAAPENGSAYVLNWRTNFTFNVRKCASCHGPRKFPSMAGFELEVVEYVPPSTQRKLSIASGINEHH